MQRKILIFSFGIIIIIALIIWIIWGNTALTTTFITYQDENLPIAFDGFRIVQISDVHDAEIGPHNQKLVAAVEEASPDIIVITGDLIDSKRTDIQRAISLASQIAEIAPTYYINGNHEALLCDADYIQLITGLEASNIIIMEDSAVELNRDNDTIRLIGLRDIGFISESSVDGKIQRMHESLTQLIGNDNSFNIALSHRPELIDSYAAAGPDLVLCGHAHGGQFRIPFIGGIIAPGQGLFPEYDSGLYQRKSTAMVVSRGIGNSVVPFRINNRPEIVVIELSAIHIY